MIELMILGQIGVLLHYLKEWVIANKIGKHYDLKKSLPMALLSSITTALCVYLKDDIKSMYVVTEFGAVMLGYFGNSLFFSFLDTKKPKTATNETPETPNSP